MRQQTVFLISSDDLGWTAVRTTLQELPTLRVVGEATDMTQAITAIAALCPDVILSSETIDDAPSWKLLADLHIRCPTARFAIFAARFDPEEMPPLLDIGLASYMLWSDLCYKALSHCLAVLMTENIVVGSRRVAEACMRMQRTTDHESLTLARLRYGITNREWEVLQLLPSDLSYKTIGGKLYIAPETVRAHVKHLAGKFSVVGQRSAVVAAAWERGLLQPILEA